MPKNTQLTKYELQRTVDIWLENDKNTTKTAQVLGLNPSTIRERLRKAEKTQKLVSQSTIYKSDKKIFILTSAQDDTKVFKSFWENLVAYAEYRDAEILIGGFTYQKGLFEDHQVKTGKFTEEVREHLVHEKINITDNLQFMGHANILPTAVNPLSGWETMSGPSWAIIPHSKIRLQSIPRMIDDDSKVIMSTGVVTEPNYFQRAAGQKAEFHHSYGAVIVEVESPGVFHTRHLNATHSGSFQDLTNLVENGVVKPNQRIEAITWGDIHLEKLEDDVVDIQWDSENSILDTLRPKEQHIHDLQDFMARNHHNIRDSHFLAEMYYKGTDSVEEESQLCVDFLDKIERPWCKTVVIQSNHDNALGRWLKDYSALTDPVNVKYWHELNYHWHNSIIDSQEDFSPFWFSLHKSAKTMNCDAVINAKFVNEGDSYKICEGSEASYIECSLHGHVGPNGSRGSPLNLSKIAPRVNSAHTHSPGIIDGVFTAGVSGSFRMGYNESGPSSWNRAHIANYPNGKRSLIFVNERTGTWKYDNT